MTWLADYYLWIKAAHIISMVAWMAGMLYLPRLFVYHAGVEPHSLASELLKVMERRLLRGIINPSMGATFVFGILLLLTPGVVDWAAGWIWVKLALVLGLSALHGLFSNWRRAFAEDRNRRTARVYRIANEVPAAILVIVVMMVVTKPF
ncbi:MAG: protoporphyrinogen oxidase HemJ [Planctomycetota bacterium]|nr:protoporphyrinogen oxidase HemJ [Pseudomonadota bacterium]MDA1180498.1 protoporphyrinogen oxidase HemJ [Planctomycetota bacterium]